MGCIGTVILLLPVCWALPAPDGVRIDLVASGDAGPTRAGFIPARLTLADPNGRLPAVVRTVTIRRKQGGPELLFATSAAPGTSQQAPVLLPAISAYDTYVVRLFRAPDVSLPTLDLELLIQSCELPVEIGNLEAVERARDLLIDPSAYEGHLEDLPRWQTGMLRTTSLAVVLVSIALAAVLLIRRPAVRLNVALLCAFVGSLATAQVLSRQRVISTWANEDFTVLTSRRTTQWMGLSTRIAPVFWSRRHMEEAELLWSEDVAALKLQPEQVYVLRHIRPRQQPALTAP